MNALRAGRRPPKHAHTQNTPPARPKTHARARNATDTPYQLPSSSAITIALGAGVSMITFVNTVPISADRCVNR